MAKPRPRGRKPRQARNQPSPRNLQWSQGFTAAVLTDPVFKRIIDETREHFRLGEPASKDCVRRNVTIASRDTVTSYLCEYFKADVDRYADHDLLCLLRPAFRGQDAAERLRERTEEPTRSDHLEEQADDIFDAMFYAGGFPQKLIALIINILTDRILEGHYLYPRPFGSWLRGDVFATSFDEDVVLLAYVTRMGDIDEVIATLKQKYREHFVPGKRDRPDENPARDGWLMAHYIRLKDEIESGTPQDDRLIEVLKDGPGYDPPSLYDHLVNAFQEGPFGHYLDGYNLDTREDQRRAKNFLKQIINRQRTDFRTHLQQAEKNAANAT